MATDISVLASDFGCSEDDIKMMLGDILSSTNEMVSTIEFLISSDDCDSISTVIDMIKSKTNHFNLNDIDSSLDALATSASAKDLSACATNFALLQTNVVELKAIL